MFDSDQEQELSWAEFILQKCKKMFGTDNLNNEDVFEYFLANLKKCKKVVSVVKDDIDIITSQHVCFMDDTSSDVWYSLFLGTEEQCKEFCKLNELIVEERYE